MTLAEKIGQMTKIEQLVAMPEGRHDQGVAGHGGRLPMTVGEPPRRIDRGLASGGARRKEEIEGDLRG